MGKMKNISIEKANDSLEDLKKAWNIDNNSTDFEWVYMSKAEKEYFIKCCELMYNRTKKQNYDKK